jgi:hypothetical protein
MKEPAVKDNLSKENKKRGLILGFPQKGIFRWVRENFKVPSYMC